MGKNLIIMGVVLVCIGLLWPLVVKLPLGRLPGDIIIRKENMNFYFPITTSVIISIIASILFWLFRK
ncbi:MAG: DUF2905 domain-containing protein [Deltaproteobacteria bacterium]|jgi:uncharacterized protein HemY|nr:DUF2905 domain-containing protein [Deltaproteobacteria bacterium]